MGTCLPISIDTSHNSFITSAQIAAGTISAQKIADATFSGQTTFNDVARVLPLLSQLPLGPKSRAALAPLLDYFSDDPQLPGILPRLNDALLAALQEEKPPGVGYASTDRPHLETILRKLSMYVVMYAG